MTESLRLPKSVERDPRGPGLLRFLSSNSRPLWSGGDMPVPAVEPGRELRRVLRTLLQAGSLVRGLESAERVLAAEGRGLRMADERSDSPRGERVSRLLLLADDGAERFYRQVETLLRRQGPRVLAVRLTMDAGALGELLFGPDRLVKLLLVVRKEAVSEVLLAMVSSPEDPVTLPSPQP